MTAERRAYDHEADCEAVCRFLVRTFDVKTPHGNWMQPRWEYANYHPLLAPADRDRWGVWTLAGHIVGVAHTEHRMGLVYCQIDPDHDELRRPMLEYAIEHLASSFQVGRAVHVYIGERDAEFQEIAASLGYERMDAKHAEPTYRLQIEHPLPRIRVPEGFRLIGLDEDDDVRKVHRLMHRGFDHEGEPPEDELDDRIRKLSAPNLRKDLTVVAVSASGVFAAFCGMWYAREHRAAYVEPVATDPEWRRMGLGTAVVMEGVRRCARIGATVAYVGSDQPFYRSMGFMPFDSQVPWRYVVEVGG